NDPKTMEHIQALAFNRTASSTGETEALNYIESELIKNNIKPEVEHFNWTGPLAILMRTSYLLIVITLILFRMILLIITYFIIKNAFSRLRKISFVVKEESKSIFTLIKSKNEIPKRPLVIITAHYDSISANIPYRLQAIIFFIYRLIVVFYGIVFFTSATIFFLDLLRVIPVTNFLIVFISFSSVGGVFISIPILYIVFKERPSSGAIDNASGVAISIELAKIFNKNPLENTDILILWPGAEEWGLKGSKAFCKNHFQSLKKMYDLDNSYNINIDMVGSYIGLLNKTGLVFRRKINKDLNDIFGATAKQLNIPLKVYNKVISPKSDYRSFKKYARKYRTKFQVSLFHSSKDSKYIHSLKDSPDKCSLESLNGCVNICHQALRSIDMRVEVLKKSQLTSAV
ncbi:MAG: M28 family peptidase, partial [Candidatus Lokiarchaeia archaeon]|nr:M28 family peptidase [Candidatus Lokiarchaeia archaeon]